MSPSAPFVFQFSAAVLGTSFIIYSASHPIQLDAPDSSAAPSSPLSPARKLISAAEVAKHRSEDSCWVIVDGKVWDVTDFLERHPGQQKLRLSLARRSFLMSSLNFLCRWGRGSPCAQRKGCQVRLLHQPVTRDLAAEISPLSHSKIFKPIHPKGIIEKTLPPEAFIG